MKTKIFAKKLLSGFLAFITVFSLMIPLLAVNSENGAPSRNEIIAGTDFSEFSTETLDFNGNKASVINDYGQYYIYKSLKTIFQIRQDGNKRFLEGEIEGAKTETVAPQFNLLTEKKLNLTNDFVVSLATRYDNKLKDAAGDGFDILKITGKDAQNKDLNFTAVKADLKGNIFYFDGATFKNSGIVLTRHQWKNVTLAFHKKGGEMTFDIYLLDTLVQKSVKMPYFKEINSIDTLVFQGGKDFKCGPVFLDYIWVYDAETPEFGLYPEIENSVPNAEMALETLVTDKTYTDTFKTEKMSVYPFGNEISVLLNGNNPYISLNHTKFSPYIEMKTQRTTIGKSQVIEACIRLGSNFIGEFELFSPYYEDTSGIVHRINMLKCNKDGEIFVEGQKDFIGKFDTESYAVISCVVSFDRSTFDVYINGECVCTGVKFAENGFDKIDGVRIVKITSEDKKSGNLFIDYALMYDGIVPESSGDGVYTEYENTFDEGKAGSFLPLELNGTEPLADKKGYYIGYKNDVNEGFIGLPIKKSDKKLYGEFSFEYSKITSDIELIAFYSGVNKAYSAVSIDKNGTLYSGTGDEKREGITLVHDKTYRITFSLDKENGCFNLYVNGEIALGYNKIEGNVSEFDKIILLRKKDRSSKIKFDNLVVYRGSRKYGASVENPELKFKAKNVIENNAHGIMLTWDSVGPAAKYTVWRSTSKFAPQEKICEMTDMSSFIDVKIKENIIYYYTVCITYLKDGKEYYVSFGEPIIEIKAVLPPEPEKPTPPPGKLPDYTSLLKLKDDFNNGKSGLVLHSESCYVEKSTGTLRILSTDEISEIPYAELNKLGTRKSNIINFKFSAKKNEGEVNIFSVYNGVKKIKDLVKYKKDILTDSDGKEIAKIKLDTVYEITVWINAECHEACVFLNSECVLKETRIPAFSKEDGKFDIRMCSAVGNVNMSVDDFLYYETRAYLSDYTHNPIYPTVTVTESSNSVSWNPVVGCKSFSVWASDSENGKYHKIAENIETTFYSDSYTGGNRYYRVTYTFDTLGVVLTTPLSMSGHGDRSSFGKNKEADAFIDFSKKGTLFIFIISVVAFVVTAVLVFPNPKEIRVKNKALADASKPKETPETDQSEKTDETDKTDESK